MDGTADSSLRRATTALRWRRKRRAAPLGMTKVYSIDAGLAEEFVGAEDQA